MTDVGDTESVWDARNRLVGAATAQALRLLVLDSVEVAAVALADLARTVVPAGPVARLRSRAEAGQDIDGTGEVAEILAWVRPYLPPEEWEDQDDRTAVTRFAAAVVDTAFDRSLAPVERAGDASFVLADLHTHLDGLAGDQWAPEETRNDIRPEVAGPGVAYDVYCMQRQNDLLQALADGAGAAAARASTDRGADFLHRALTGLLAAGRI